MLTVMQATSQARRRVDRVIPGVMATVTSRLSYDLKTDTDLMVTTITFPRELSVDGNINPLCELLDSLTGSRGTEVFPDRVILTRQR